MNSKQLEYMILVIRGYDLAFKATSEENYRITRDKLLKALEAELRAKNGMLKKVA